MVSSPSSSPMMAGSEILDGSSLMSLQLHLQEEIVLSSFSSSFLKKVSVPPTLSLSATQDHERSLGFFIKALEPHLLPNACPHRGSLSNLEEEGRHFLRHAPRPPIR